MKSKELNHRQKLHWKLSFAFVYLIAAWASIEWIPSMELRWPVIAIWILISLVVWPYLLISAIRDVWIIRARRTPPS